MITEYNLQQQVADWSIYNFGHQVSKFDTSVLHATAPLLGIVEELGELDQASTTEEVVDAIADIIIYSCDFCSRMTIELPPVTEEHISHTAMSLAGNLCHHVLKTHQGIRGYADKKFALEQITATISQILSYLNNTCVQLELPSPMECAVTTFTHTVQKRNWKENPNG